MGVGLVLALIWGLVAVREDVICLTVLGASLHHEHLLVVTLRFQTTNFHDAQEADTCTQTTPKQD